MRLVAFFFLCGVVGCELAPTVDQVSVTEIDLPAVDRSVTSFLETTSSQGGESDDNHTAYYFLVVAMLLTSTTLLMTHLMPPNGVRSPSDESNTQSGTNGLSPLSLDEKSTVHHGDSIRAQTVKFFYTIQAIAGVTISRVECNLDDLRWDICPSPTTFEHLRFGSHEVHFRCLNSDGLPIGADQVVAWVVLPSKEGEENNDGKDGSALQHGDNAEQLVELLPPTRLSTRPGKQNISHAMDRHEDRESVVKQLVPSSHERPIRAIPLPDHTIKIEEKAKNNNEPEFDPLLVGPFSEKALLDLTPKQLRTALRMSSQAQSYTAEQIMAMAPDRIRDIIRAIGKMPVQANPFCTKKDGSEGAGDCPPPISKWPVKK